MCPPKGNVFPWDLALERVCEVYARARAQVWMCVHGRQVDVGIESESVIID